MKTRLVNHTIIFALLLQACGAQVDLPGDGPDPGASALLPPPDATQTTERGASLDLPLIDYSAHSPQELIAIIIDADSGLEVVAAVQEALRRGGISTISAGEVLLPGLEPQAVNPATIEEALFLAIEARQRGSMVRMTLADLGWMLADFGFPFEEAGDPAGEMLVFFQTWVSLALDSPSAPESFVPLLIAGMIERQQPPVDLLASDADPAAIGLGLLELELWAAALTRLIDSSALSVSQTPSLGLVGAAILAPLQFTGNAPPSYCAPWYKTLFQGDLQGLDELANQVPGMNPLGSLLGEVFKKIGFDETDLGRLNRGLAAAALAARLLKLAAMRATLSLEISSPGENPLHKPMPSDATLDRAFIVSVGLDPALWQPFHDAVGKTGREALALARECMNALGVPMITDPGELAGEISKYSVEWEIDRGAEHANWSLPAQTSPGRPHLGSWRTPLRMTTDYSGESGFVVRLKKAYNEVPQHYGLKVSDDVRVCARVDLTQPPTLGTFASAATGGLGLSSSMVELAAGLLMKIAKPAKCAILTVFWHQPADLLLEVELVVEERYVPLAMFEKHLWLEWRHASSFSLRLQPDGAGKYHGSASSVLELTSASERLSMCDTCTPSNAPVLSCEMGETAAITWEAEASPGPGDFLTVRFSPSHALLNGCFIDTPTIKSHAVLRGAISFPFADGDYQEIQPLGFGPQFGPCAFPDGCTAAWVYNVTIVPRK